MQELALSSKPGLLAAIDELEKMGAALREALKEEVTAAAAEARKAALAEAEAGEQGPRPMFAGRRRCRRRLARALPVDRPISARRPAACHANPRAVPLPPCSRRQGAGGAQGRG